MSLIKMFREGPEVSLSGSPTVSPMTAALWASVPFPPSMRACSVLPASKYFLALSQAPPVLEAEMASWTPEMRAPTRTPARVLTPKRVPTTRGVKMTKAPGGPISAREACVEISMHFLYSGFVVPSIKPGIVLNCLLTSSTMARAALPTLFMVMALNQYGSIAPIKSPGKTFLSRMEALAKSISARVTYAPKRAKDTRAAEPMAKPFPTAAVVFPAASRASVLSRISSPISAISAIPPALSEIGP
mmetsp:Transcript_5154/g.15488  ORF Transcript_5154/g.15488 Transcript_5154/m.15488 type:complete len:245 (+) Transcript_5154:1796-2530(+)